MNSPGSGAQLQKFTLLKTQQTDVLSVIQQNDLNALDFSWAEEHLEAVPGFADACDVSILRHDPTGYYFLFDARNKHRVKFSPGANTTHQCEYPGPWSGAIGYVKQWAQDLKREIDAPDLWGEFLKERAVFDAAGASVVDNSPFTVDEQKRVVETLLEVERFLLATQAADAELRESIDHRFRYLQGAVARLGRSDWFHTMIGVITSIAVSGLVTRERVSELFRFIADAFSYLVQPLLPS